ncbi:helix-turn-helix domain-containing protein [bacterium CPR1]|nr:helix-turn-helix domain-containing protein [bacterium CPR1]
MPFARLAPRSKRLTLRQAANRIGVSTATIRRRIKDGSLRAYMAPGRFGTQWLVAPEDLEQVQFYPQEDLEDSEDLNEGEATPGPLDPDQAPPNKDQDWDTGPTVAYPIEPEEDDLPAPTLLNPSLEHQAIHQAGYWKGRWEEARERVQELENRLLSLPSPQVLADLEESRMVEEATRQDLEDMRSQLALLSQDKAELEQELIRLKTPRPPWWRRLLFKEVP